MVIVTIEQGQLIGGTVATDSGVTYHEFLCVPYAKPPIGELRFKSPQPPEPWSGVRDATTVNNDNICMQINLMSGVLTGSEDCLYLNVFTPKLPGSQTSLVPVMVFIHGGAFFYGNGIDKGDIGPDYLIENNVIVVTINYRLGLLGFLALDIPEAAGNMGLKDQLQALKWVQSNIKHFGGDHNNVTIFGISAGSASVEYHMLSPLSKGLFHKAIMQSGSPLNHWVKNADQRSLINRLLKRMKYSGSMDDSNEIHQYMLSCPIEHLLEAAQTVIDTFTSNRLFIGFVPTIEKDFGNGDSFISDCPYKLLREGKFTRVPAIKGFCAKEGYLTCVTKPNVMKELLQNKDFLKHFALKIEEEDKEKLSADLIAAYVDPTLPDEKIAVDFFGDLDFIAGIWLSALIMADLNVPIYFYEFSYDGKINLIKHLFGIVKEGASHADDTAYIFKHRMVTKFAEDKDIAVRSNLTKLWTNFAKTSVPTIEDSEVDWPIFSSSAPVYLNIDDKLSLKSNYEPKRMAVFKEIYDKYEKY